LAGSRCLANRFDNPEAPAARLVGEPRRECKKALITPFVAINDEIGGAQSEQVVCAVENLMPIENIPGLARHIRERRPAYRYGAEDT
jgi:hypothetical protein